jgi:hypothetical protein
MAWGWDHVNRSIAEIYLGKAIRPIDEVVVPPDSSNHSSRTWIAGDGPQFVLFTPPHSYMSSRVNLP